MSAPPHPPQRVAVVGSGLAGLLSAHLLARDGRQRYAVTIYESGRSFSLDAASVSIPNATHSTPDRVDLPMRAFAGGYYHNLRALYDYLGIRYHPQPFLFDFATSAAHGPRDTSYFAHASNLHQLAPRPATVGRTTYIAELAYLVVSYVWFLLCCLLVSPGRGETLHHYLQRTRMPRHFVSGYLLPLMSSVTTCPHTALLDFPASDIVGYKRGTHGAPHYCVSQGVGQVQHRLARDIPFQLNASVTAVEPSDKGVRLSWIRSSGADRKTHKEYFDKVILAVSPDVVSHIFQPLQHHLSQIPTAVVESIVHTDVRVLGHADPRRTGRPETQLIHLHTSTGAVRQTESHHVQPCGAIVTTCPFSPIDPACVIRVSKFTRVLRSPKSQQVVNAIFSNHTAPCPDKSVPLWKNGDDNIWLAGGWCWDGMVLLEGCVVSAVRVAHALGVEVPWRHDDRALQT
ncbi:FAD/NAD(P)-binding domain-containing protein [Plenodomus tracheiphilus IPT5]|uniref:FAD/NAD(P)-binding domain-containing protein n=1 Tax=Plenodomus tracheiphilus IPT5 TaxID=1408161 RepID=A0A6A7BD47_9PLEO|nr:FAD/NAD(P)-binding domain-containing protein [Plenodomus tracheiphilus IPT5]